MCKHHVVYESKPCRVIVSLGVQFYWIPNIVAPTPTKQDIKILSHTGIFSFLIISSKGKQPITKTYTTSAQGPFTQKKQQEHKVIVVSSIRVPL